MERQAREAGKRDGVESPDSEVRKLSSGEREETRA